MTQNSVKCSSENSGSVKKDKVRAEDVVSKVPNISQTLPISSSATAKKIEVLFIFVVL